MTTHLLRLLHSILLTTGACPLCRNRVVRGSPICEQCSAKIVKKGVMDERVIPHIRRWRAFSAYEGELAEAIVAVKFRHLKPLARIIGSKIKTDLLEFKEENRCDLITYVPVSWRRKIMRGFDHCEEILKGAGLEFDKILVRVRHSKPLAQLSREERIKAVEGAFRVVKTKRGLVKGSRVLLFDDILTTGFTASCVAEELMQAGAKEVFLYTVAVQS